MQQQRKNTTITITHPKICFNTSGPSHRLGGEGHVQGLNSGLAHAKEGTLQLSYVGDNQESTKCL